MPDQAYDYGNPIAKLTPGDNGTETWESGPVLIPGETLYYVVTVVDTAGLESGPSNEVTVSVDRDPPTVELSCEAPMRKYPNVLGPAARFYTSGQSSQPVNSVVLAVSTDGTEMFI